MVVAVALLLWWVGRSLAPRLLGIVSHIQSLGPAAPVAFILIYAFAVVALIPASLLTVAGGAVFGLIRGVIFSLVGATLGSTCGFLLGRYVARRLVARRLSAMPRFVAIEKAVSARGRRIVFLLRLSPVIPFNVLNYALGISEARLGQYVAASFLGMLPGTWMYVYLGSLAVTAAGLGDTSRAGASGRLSLTALGLAATVAVVVLVTRSARRALDEELAKERA